MKTLLLSLVSLFFIGSCSTAPKKTPNEIRADRILEIMEDYFEAYLRLNPLFATSIGDSRFDAELEVPYTEEYRKRFETLMETSLSRIRETGCRDLPASVLLSCQTFTAELENELALHRADLDRYLPFNQFDSFFSSFAELAAGSSYVEFRSGQDYRNFMSRIRKAPGYLEASKEAMQEGMRKSIVVPKVLAERAIQQMKELLPADFKKSVFYKPLENFPKTVSKSEQAEIRPLYEELIRDTLYPAYRSFLEFAEKEYLPRCRSTSGVSALPGGRDFYRALVRHHTLTEMSPDRIMTLGLSEVTRIRKQLMEAKNQLGFKGSLPEFFQALRSQAALYPFRTSKEVIDAYSRIQSVVRTRLPAYFRLTPKAGFEIREVEKFKAESASEAYQNPSADGSRPGIFWVPIPNPARYELKSMESLFLHEAIPGHHFQIALQQELDLPRYRKFFGNNAFVEGWGLYAESLGKELGLYTDLHQWVGRLQYEMHRALRLVVDVGIHWKGWSRERAIRYSLENEPMDEAGVRAEIERYMAIPGQALSYKIGELKIQELKTLAKKELGADFHEGEFHDQILEDGALPLSVLDQKIRSWIEKKRGANHS